MMSKAPAFSDQFMSLLQPYNISGLDTSLAQLLRIHASTRFYGTIMTSGNNALPFVPWLIDGMNMSNKLIVHLNDGNESLKNIIKKTTDTDIRLTCHCQSQIEFTSDIIEHRLDLVLLTEESIDIFDRWVSLLSETGMLVLMASPEIRKSLLEKYADDYFCFDDGYLTMTQKGQQHKKARRRNRQRKSIATK